MSTTIYYNANGTTGTSSSYIYSLEYTASGSNCYISKMGYYISGLSTPFNVILPLQVDINGFKPLNYIGIVFQGKTYLQSISFPSDSKVTSIIGTAFQGCSGLNSINIPSLVTTIGNSTFQDCSSLTSINIPSSITSLGISTFQSCTSLPYIYLPSVTSIGNNCFAGCTSLRVVLFGLASTSITTGTTPYNNCNDYIYNLYSIASANIYTDSNITYILNTSNNTASIISGSGLSGTIIIPSTIINTSYSVTSINDLAFLNNKNLSTITLPSSVTTLGNGAFYACNQLQNVSIPNGILYIGNDILSNITGTINITYNPTVSDLPSNVSWYRLIVKLNSNNSFIFDSYFAVINTTNFIKLMYQTSDLTTNIIAPYTRNDNFNGHGFVNGTFDNTGLNIAGSYITIPTYNPFMWQINSNNTLNYQNTLGGGWSSVPANTVSYTIVSSTPPSPLVPVCFPKGTPVNTDQGIVDIDKINTSYHTIRNNKIVAITETVTLQKHIICIEKHALALNIPSQNTYISLNHQVFYKGKMIPAKDLVGKVEGVYRKKYDKSPLYNVLLDKHDKMVINNMIVETLSPDNIVAKIYNSNLNFLEKGKVIENLNKMIETNNIDEFKNFYEKFDVINTNKLTN